MTLLLVRHAEAGSRSGWAGPDRLRPLSAKGRQQALGLIHGLGDRYRITRLVSSPFLRCIETLAPLASVLGCSLEVAEVLAEGIEVEAALALARLGATGADEALVVCSHGDLIPAMLETLHSVDGLDLGAQPRCQKGSTWVLDGADGTFGAAAYRPPG